MTAIITPALAAPSPSAWFSALLIFMGLWLVFVYCPIAHWPGAASSALQRRLCRRHGRPHQRRCAGLVCALVLGKREGYGNQHGAAQPRLLVIGASLLWVGSASTRFGG
jgi:Amt family ammonium transporter